VSDVRPEEPPPERDVPPGLLVGVTLFYGLMAVGAFGLAAICDLDLAAVALGEPSSALPHAHAAAAGAGVGLALVLLSRPFLKRRAMAGLRASLREALGRPGPAAICVLAATSAIGEELLFRGVLQHLVGLWPTALLFALLHGGGAPRLLGWTLFAAGAGVALAFLAQATGSLLAPLIAHFTVNQLNIGALTALPPEDAA
jgi:membrane protease YdiL (CAAX protease family)